MSDKGLTSPVQDGFGTGGVSNAGFVNGSMGGGSGKGLSTPTTEKYGNSGPSTALPSGGTEIAGKLPGGAGLVSPVKDI